MDFAWLWVVPILGILIVVHEMGHFFTAIWLGIRVEEFGIGFPPRAFAIKRNDIEYSLNWLPIGGFVKITGENGDSDDPRAFGKAAAWKRIIVLAAGSTMNLVMAIIIFAITSVMGVQQVDAPQTTIGSVSVGLPAETGKMLPGDRIVSIAGTDVKTEDDIRAQSRANAGKPTTYVVERLGQRVPLTLTPRNEQVSLGVGLQYYLPSPKVEAVRSGSVADKAGFKPGDVIVAVNGTPVKHRTELLVLLGKEDKETAEITVQRGVQTVPLQMEVKSGSAPVSTGITFDVPIKTIYYSPFESLGRALGNTWEVISMIPRGIGDAIGGQAQGPGVTGIVGISQLTGEVAQDSGISGLLNLTALLGISLFMINLLPLPALDGGRLLFIFIELLRGGRRIAPEKEGLVHFAGMVVLLALMLLITLFDVGRLIGGERLLP